jgi:hypothetical protein
MSVKAKVAKPLRGALSARVKDSLRRLRAQLEAKTGK